MLTRLVSDLTEFARAAFTPSAEVRVDREGRFYVHREMNLSTGWSTGPELLGFDRLSAEAELFDLVALEDGEHFAAEQWRKLLGEAQPTLVARRGGGESAHIQAAES